MTNNNSNFEAFLDEVMNANLNTVVTTIGTKIIQQSTRNNLRKVGVEAFKKDLEAMFAHRDDISILETKDGIVVAVENAAGDFTFSWEIKSAIKSLDYDPFIEAGNYDDAVAEKQAKKERIEKEKADKIAKMMEKRAKKLAEVAEKNNRNAENA